MLTLFCFLDLHKLLVPFHPTALVIRSIGEHFVLQSQMESKCINHTLLAGRTRGSWGAREKSSESLAEVNPAPIPGAQCPAKGLMEEPLCSPGASDGLLAAKLLGSYSAPETHGNAISGDETWPGNRVASSRSPAAPPHTQAEAGCCGAVHLWRCSPAWNPFAVGPQHPQTTSRHALQPALTLANTGLR